MSAIAIQLLDRLRESGVEDDRAVKIAEAEEKAKAQFVPVADYHARDKTLATREDLHTEIAAVRADNTETNRRLDNIHNSLLAEIRGISRLLVGGFIAIVAGVVTVIAKLFFGV